MNRTNELDDILTKMQTSKPSIKFQKDEKEKYDVLHEVFIKNYEQFLNIKKYINVNKTKIPVIDNKNKEQFDKEKSTKYQLGRFRS